MTGEETQCTMLKISITAEELVGVGGMVLQGSCRMHLDHGADQGGCIVVEV